LATCDATFAAKIEIAATSCMVNGRRYAAEKAKMKGQSDFQRLGWNAIGRGRVSNYSD
jgi:hypothetical protein